MGLIDYLIAPFRQEKPKPTETVGVSGTPIFGGYISSPEKNPLLIGARRYETYSQDVANTAIVGAGVRLFLNLVAKPEWKCIPADDSEEAAQIAERIDFILHDMTQPWHSIVRTAARFRFYGFSIQEWTAKKLDDGTIGLLDVEARPQYTIEQWDADATGTVRGVVQRDPATARPIYLPRGKVVYLVDNSLTDSPDGVGLLRHVAESVRHLVRLEQLEGFGFESDLGGVPVGRAPVVKLNQMVTNGQITAEQRDSMLRGLRDFVSNRIKNPSQGLVLDSLTYTDLSEAASPSGVNQWGVDILRSETSGLAPLSAAIERLNREIARVLGVEHLMLGGDGAGSLALSRDKTSQFATLVEGTLNELAWGFEHDLLEPLRQLNGWPKELMPRLMPGSIQMRDVQDVAETLALLAQAGAPLMPGDDAINEVRAQLKLSPAPDASAGSTLIPEPSMLGEPPIAPDMPAAATAGDPVQATAFNGAQISSMVDIATAVREGRLDRSAAVEIIATMFPVDRSKAEAILAGGLVAPPSAKAAAIAKASARSGCMIALLPDEATARKVVEMGADPAELQHVTLAYMGKDATPELVAAAIRCAEEWAARTAPIAGSLAGIGRFSGSGTSDGKDVVFASVDAPGLGESRARLVSALRHHGVEASAAHGFTPHMTLRYVGKDEPTDPRRIDATPASWPMVVVAAGDERHPILLTGKA